MIFFHLTSDNSRQTDNVAFFDIFTVTFEKNNKNQKFLVDLN